MGFSYRYPQFVLEKISKNRQIPRLSAHTEGGNFSWYPSSQTKPMRTESSLGGGMRKALRIRFFSAYIASAVARRSEIASSKPRCVSKSRFRIFLNCSPRTTDCSSKNRRFTLGSCAIETLGRSIRSATRETMVNGSNGRGLVRRDPAGRF